jgi:hypothetical protein
MNGKTQQTRSESERERVSEKRNSKAEMIKNMFMNFNIQNGACRREPVCMFFFSLSHSVERGVAISWFLCCS